MRLREDRRSRTPACVYIQTKLDVLNGRFLMFVFVVRVLMVVVVSVFVFVFRRATANGFNGQN